jgi:sensor domain CHASE-containing protein
MAKGVLSAVLLITLLSPVFSEAASSDTELILEQIRQLREDMDKRFEQVDKRFEQVDKRFEQVDKRFEQVEKRIEFLQAVLLALLAVVIGGTGYNIWQGMKIPKGLDAYIEKVQRLEIALREIASKDPQTMEHLKRLGLL